jgi:hypothetical protein
VKELPDDLTFHFVIDAETVCAAAELITCERFSCHYLHSSQP